MTIPKIRERILPSIIQKVPDNSLFFISILAFQFKLSINQNVATQ